MDILADTHGFEGDFAHQLPLGRHAGLGYPARIKLEAGFVLEYTKSLN